MSRRCVIYILQISYSHWRIPTSLATIGILDLLYISAWGSTLLVSAGWAMREALKSEASDSAGLHAFFCVLKFNHFL